MSAPTKEDRWQHLVAGSFALAEEGGDAKDRLAAAERYLTSVLEVFPPGLDPVEDFEGYAVRRMALALLEAARGLPERSADE